MIQTKLAKDKIQYLQQKPWGNNKKKWPHFDIAKRFGACDFPDLQNWTICKNVIVLLIDACCKKSRGWQIIVISINVLFHQTHCIQILNFETIMLSNDPQFMISWTLTGMWQTSKTDNTRDIFTFMKMWMQVLATVLKVF